VVIGALATIALGVGLAGLFLGLRSSEDSPEALGSGPGPAAADQAADAGADPAAEGEAAPQEGEPAPEWTTEVSRGQAEALDAVGIPVGQGGAADLGAASGPAAVTVHVFSDFMCPYCGQFDGAYGGQLVQAVDSGEINLVLHPIAILDQYSQGTDYSSRAAGAAWAVAAADPAHFAAFHAALFAAQPEENTPGLTDQEIGQIAEDAGVPAAVAATLVTEETVAQAGTATEQAMGAGVNGTPTVLVATAGSDLAPIRWDWATMDLAQVIEIARAD
jgi:protein-disulfide isomerase